MARTTRPPFIATLAASLLIDSAAALAAPRLVLKKIASQPREGRSALGAKEVAALREAVIEEPKDRGARLALVMGLLRKLSLSRTTLSSENDVHRAGADVGLVRVGTGVNGKRWQTDRATASSFGR